MNGRPKFLHVGGVLYWTIRTRNPDTMVLKDADSTPTVAVRKNGASTGDSVTVTKRSATTGIYDCSYNPAGEVEGDEFTIEETATVTGTTTGAATYSNSWEFSAVAVERGTDSALTTLGATAPANWINAASIASDSITAIAAGVWNALTSGLTTVGSIGKRIVDNLDAAITSRQATVSFPTNFSLLSIDGSGRVTVGANADKSGYALASNGLLPVTAWTVALTGNLSGSVGSVVGAVGSVTGNVGGNVAGSVGSVAGNVGGNVVGSVGSVVNGVTVSTINSNVITAASFATDAAAEIADATYNKFNTFPPNVNVVEMGGVDIQGYAADNFHTWFTNNSVTLTATQGVGTVIDIKADTSTLLSRITAGVATLFTNLIAMITGSGASAKYTALALEDAPTGTGGGGGTGTGARTVTITVQDSSAAAIQNATVRVSRTGETFAAQTNASGVIVFNLDDATWTVSITATGFSFAGATLVVDGTEAVTYTMTTAGGGVTPSTPPLTTGYWTVYDNAGVAQAAAQVSIQASSPPKGSTGLVMEDAVRTATADSNGVVQFSNLVKGATYTVYRTGSTRKYQILVPTTAGTTVALGSIVG